MLPLLYTSIGMTHMNAVDSFNCAVSERHRRPFKLPVLILLNTETEIWNNFYFLVNNNNNKTILLTLFFFFF